MKRPGTSGIAVCSSSDITWSQSIFFFFLSPAFLPVSFSLNLSCWPAAVSVYFFLESLIKTNYLGYVHWKKLMQGTDYTGEGIV